jgi:hypothetical protein
VPLSREQHLGPADKDCQDEAICTRLGAIPWTFRIRWYQLRPCKEELHNSYSPNTASKS